MKMKFVRDWIKEQGWDITQAEMDWWKQYSNGAQDLEHHFLLYAMVRNFPILTALEIGCAGGGASFAMLEAGALVTGVDIKIGATSCKGALMIKGDSSEVVPELIARGNRFDLVFVDGNHDYPFTLHEFKNAQSISERFVVFHDYGLEKGVTKSMDELWGKPKTVLKDNYKHPELNAGIVIREKIDGKFQYI